MAGAGYKLFNTGDVLTAAQVNTYLQQQVTMVFADSSARTTALSGVLAEGMMSYLQDTNAVEVYDGSNWVSVGNTGDITGVTAGTGLTGGGTSGTVTLTNDMAVTITAKGDLLVGTGNATYDNLAAGTDGYTLVADSAETTGLKWQAPAAGGTSNYSLLNAGGTALTGASTITVSGISGQEKLHIIVDSASSANASSAMSIRINTDSGTNYYYGGIKWKADSTEYFTAELTNSYRTNTDSIYLGAMGSNAAMQMGISVFIDGGTTTGGKGFIAQGGRSGTTSGQTGIWTVISGVYLGSAAITSVSLISSSGNFDNGTIYVYGSA